MCGNRLIRHYADPLTLMELLIFYLPLAMIEKTDASLKLLEEGGAAYMHWVWAVSETFGDYISKFSQISK